MVTRSCRVESAGTSHDSHAEPQDQTDPQRYVSFSYFSFFPFQSYRYLPSPAGALPIMQHCTDTEREGQREKRGGGDPVSFCLNLTENKKE